MADGDQTGSAAPPPPALASPAAIGVLLHCPPASPGLAATLASLLGAAAGLDWQLVAVQHRPEPLLDAFAARQPPGRVQLLVAAPDATPAHCRNQALAHCQAELVACLEAGQRCLPGRLAGPLQLLQEHQEIDLVWGGWRVGAQQHEPWQRQPGFSAAARLQDPCLAAGALTVRRPVLEELQGFAADLPAWSGVDLALRLEQAGGGSAWLAAPLLQWRPAATAQPWPVAALQAGWERLLQRHGEGLRPEQLVELRCAALAWCAGLAWHQQQPQQCRSLLLEAALSAPLPLPRALALLLEQFSRSQRWCGGDGDAAALLASPLWARALALWS